MYLEKCLAFGLFVGLNISLSLTLSALGPGHVVIERLETCDDKEKYPVENVLAMKKINRTTTGMTGCVQFPEDLGPTSSMQMILAKWGDGGWKPNAYNFNEKDMCEFVQKYLKAPLEDILESNGLKNEGCPLKKNTLCLKNFIVSLGEAVPAVLYGKFKADVIILIDSKPIFCLRTYLVSTPSVPLWQKR